MVELTKSKGQHVDFSFFLQGEVFFLLSYAKRFFVWKIS